jgi:acyl-CoA thioesterase
MTDFDRSLALVAVEPELWRGTADSRYEANNGMFGGWTVALLLKAVIDHPDASGSAIAITVNFIAAVPPGENLRLRTSRLGAGRSLSHWRVDLSADGSDALLCTALVILANRRETDRYTEGAVPDIPAPEALPAFHPPFPHQPPLEIRSNAAGPPINQGHSRTLGWEKETSGRPIDVLTLALLSDLGIPRIFTISPALRPSATLTLSINFLAGGSELAACGDDFILSEMVATRIEQSVVGTKKTMWSRAGALLATSEQVCWFR